ncbi:hypothetical protein RJ641_001376 [Dillenia turbinata]|uniref:Uncharacterized protein n=1 Tax=Dillenia turbinata TaxID=194707 RepID=A0AAN8W840_9MAGN
MEVQNEKTKARLIWDCESTLYDSFELQSFNKQLESAIVSRTLSMPHLVSSRAPPPPAATANPQPPAAKRASNFSRSLTKFLRSFFKPRPNSAPTGPISNIRGQTKGGLYILYDKSGALSTIPEVPETVSEYAEVAPAHNSLVSRDVNGCETPMHGKKYTMSDLYRPVLRGSRKETTTEERFSMEEALLQRSMKEKEKWVPGEDKEETLGIKGDGKRVLGRLVRVVGREERLDIGGLNKIISGPHEEDHNALPYFTYPSDRMGSLEVGQASLGVKHNYERRPFVIGRPNKKNCLMPKRLTVANDALYKLS